MDIQLVRPADLTADQLTMWSRLQREQVEINSPYFRPEYTQAVSRVRSDVEVAILRQQSATLGFFPFQRDTFNIGKPVGNRLSDFHGVIAHQDLKWSVEELMHGCRLAAWDFNHLIASQSPFRAHHRIIEESPYIDLSSGYEAYVSERHASKSDRFKQAQRESRRFERDMGPLRLEWNTADVTVLETLLQWKSQQYRRTNLLDIFQFSWVVKLLELIKAQATEEFSGVLSALYANDQLVAAHFGMRSGDVLHYWFPAYDREFQKYSPGKALMVEMAKAAHSAGIHRIDLGKGTDQFKRIFRSRATLVAEGSVECQRVSKVIRQSWRHTRDWIKSSPLRRPVDLSLQATRPLRRWIAFR